MEIAVALEKSKALVKSLWRSRRRPPSLSIKALSHNTLALADFKLNAITLNRKDVSKKSWRSVRISVLHEIAHILRGPLGHDGKWVRTCRMLGIGTHAAAYFHKMKVIRKKAQGVFKKRYKLTCSRLHLLKNLQKLMQQAKKNKTFRKKITALSRRIIKFIHRIDALVFKMDVFISRTLASAR